MVDKERRGGKEEAQNHPSPSTITREPPITLTPEPRLTLSPHPRITHHPQALPKNHPSPSTITREPPPLTPHPGTTSPPPQPLLSSLCPDHFVSLHGPRERRSKRKTRTG
ncbi:hypothetical protein Pcinc_030403 [Petrolisthes cinctipes]|uniref:Uncharacterized protein n=1 Tax=Petrolisthes cinctipes TaxID=88211 RepID=A0AAE1EYW4_PETCI|nr:hypothetical protein Pcinc_030403 [Petrolisthes cinctipes]